MHQIGIKLFSSSGGGEAPPSPTDGSAGAPPPPPPPPGPSFGGQSSEPTPLLDRNMSKEEWDYETYESDPSSFPTEVAPHILVALFLAFEAKINFLIQIRQANLPRAHASYDYDSQGAEDILR